jgi:hypothetical protein
MVDQPESWARFASEHPDLLQHRGGAFERLYSGTDIEQPAARRWLLLPRAPRARRKQPTAEAVGTVAGDSTGAAARRGGELPRDLALA